MVASAMVAMVRIGLEFMRAAQELAVETSARREARERRGSRRSTPRVRLESFLQA